MEENYANPNPYSLKKIVLLGPESTGKTTLANQLANHYGIVLVPEYARTYLDELDRPYREDDLLVIARGQLEREDLLVAEAADILIYDTNLWVIKIWSEYKYGSCHPWIEEQIKHREYDFYLLTDIDVRWQADSQREHPDHRDTLFEIYQRHLRSQPVPFEILHGNREDRLRRAIALIDSLV